MTPQTGKPLSADASDDWEAHWLEYASSASFNPAQAFRRDLIWELIRRRAPQASRILDIGSGQGDLAADLQARLPGAEILGVELSATGVEMARRKAPSAQFLQCNLLQTAEPPHEHRRWAQVAVCSEVLEHVDEPAALLRNARAFLAERCLVIVTVPGGPMSAFDRHIGHRRHYTPEALSLLLGRAGFEVEFAAGAGFPFFNLYRLAVLARGASLVDRAKVQAVDSLSRTEELVLSGFRRLLRRNHARGKRGWQVIACARESGNP
jgi:SAM-dependent methyltransferase